MNFLTNHLSFAVLAVCGVILNADCGQAENSEADSADNVRAELSAPVIGDVHQDSSMTGRIEETTLSSCFIDPPFNKDLVTYSMSKCGEDFCWWNAHYKHSYLQRKIILVTTFDSYGNVESQDRITRDSPLSVAMKSLQLYRSLNRYDAYRPTNPEPAIDEMRRHHGSDVGGRMLMQCTGQGG